MLKELQRVSVSCCKIAHLNGEKGKIVILTRAKITRFRETKSVGLILSITATRRRQSLARFDLPLTVRTIIVQKHRSRDSYYLGVYQVYSVHPAQDTLAFRLKDGICPRKTNRKR